MITLESFKKLYAFLDGEPEFKISIRGTSQEYMIIKYGDGAEFLRCGNDAPLPMKKYGSLEELLASSDIDGICLSKEWGYIEDIIVNGGLSATDDFEELCETSGLRLEETTQEFKRRWDALTLYLGEDFYSYFGPIVELLGEDIKDYDFLFISCDCPSYDPAMDDINQRSWEEKLVIDGERLRDIIHAQKADTQFNAGAVLAYKKDSPIDYEPHGLDMLYGDGFYEEMLSLFQNPDVTFIFLPFDSSFTDFWCKNKAISHRFLLRYPLAMKSFGHREHGLPAFSMWFRPKHPIKKGLFGKVLFNEEKESLSITLERCADYDVIALRMPLFLYCVYATHEHSFYEYSRFKEYCNQLLDDWVTAQHFDELCDKITQYPQHGLSVLGEEYRCPKCGKEWTYCCGSWQCRNCGYGAATTWSPGLIMDSGPYTVEYRNAEKLTRNECSVIASLTGLNYLQIQDALREGPLVLSQGDAIRTRQVLLILQEKGFAFTCSPDFPYDINDPLYG